MVEFHHVPRNSSPLGLLCHHLANQARCCQSACLELALGQLGCTSVDRLLQAWPIVDSDSPQDPSG